MELIHPAEVAPESQAETAEVESVRGSHRTLQRSVDGCDPELNSLARRRVCEVLSDGVGEGRSSQAGLRAPRLHHRGREIHALHGAARGPAAGLRAPLCYARAGGSEEAGRSRCLPGTYVPGYRVGVASRLRLVPL